MVSASPRRALQVPGLRACALCVHTAGQQAASDLLCRSEAALICHADGIPVARARAADGCCGPNAIHLDMLSWRTHRTEARTLAQA